jgi:hypothetical protein
MFRSWTKLARSASLLGFESHQVIALRLSKLAQGGEAAQKEAHRMLAEKITAAQSGAACKSTKKKDPPERRVPECSELPQPWMI